MKVILFIESKRRFLDYSLKYLVIHIVIIIFILYKINIKENNKHQSEETITNMLLHNAQHLLKHPQWWLNYSILLQGKCSPLYSDSPSIIQWGFGRFTVHQVVIYIDERLGGIPTAHINILHIYISMKHHVEQCGLWILLAVL